MTEAEWLACEDPADMLEFIRVTASERKLRLFACVCCRLIPGYLESDAYRASLELTEQDVESSVSEDAINRLAEQWSMHWSRRSPQEEVRLALESYRDAAGGEKVREGRSKKHRLKRGQLNLALVAPFRDIFRPVTIAPSRLSSTVTALAREMYDARDFSALPILADALQDAGCDRADILDHCRGPLLSRPLRLAEPGERDEKSPHVRGCWVVDLVLGKE